MHWNAIRKRLFFTDAPAQGAFYALTQLLLGSYLVFSLFVFLLGIGWVTITMPAVWIAAGVVTVLFCYYLVMTLTFFRSQQSGFQRHLSWLYFVLWAGLLLWGYFRLSLPGICTGWLFAFFFTGVLPLFFCGRQWKPAFGSALAWCVGTLMLLPPLFSGIRHGNDQGSTVCDLSIPKYLDFLGISGWGWSVWTAAGLLILALWYWLTALFFARLSGVKKSSLFGKGVILWWSTGVAVFLLFIILTCFAGKEVSRRIAELEKRFGRPLTAEALAECYFNGRKPDAAFWERWEKNQEAVSPFPPEKDYSAFATTPSSVQISADGMKLWRKRFKQYNGALTEWEAQFADPLPPRPRQYRRGRLVHLLLQELHPFRRFNRIQLWRIHFALTDGQSEEALAAERRMKQGNQYLQQDSFLISALVWAVCEELRLSGIEMLLESGKLPESTLHRLSAELAEQEKAIPPLLERVLYSEAVLIFDTCDDWASGEYSSVDGASHASPRALGGFVPQLWWYLRREMANMAEFYNLLDLSQPEKKPAFRHPNLLASVFIPSYLRIATKFDRLTARFRAVRGLIQAELYRRKHGNWPERLPDLPLDPFSGKPLLYRKGECVQQVKVLKQAGDPPPPKGRFFTDASTKWIADEEFRTVPAIQVWSVGPDGVDDGGFRPDGSHCDDVRALLRLRPEER